MRPSRFFIVFVSFLLVGLSGRLLATESVPLDSLQLQRSSYLAASRYIENFRDIQEHEGLKTTQQSLDWWIDLSILELASLESEYPDFEWGQVSIDPSGILKINRIYKKIAQYRASQPRIHHVPLQEDQVRLIQKFTQKYK